VIEKIGCDCPGEHKRKNEELIRALSSLSVNILREIQFKPGEHPLSRIAKHFRKGSVGCGGGDSIGKYSASSSVLPDVTTTCQQRRRPGMTGAFENMRYSKSQIFGLTVGN